MHCVDLGESFHMSTNIYRQNLASIQPLERAPRKACPLSALAQIPLGGAVARPEPFMDAASSSVILPTKKDGAGYLSENYIP